MKMLTTWSNNVVLHTNIPNLGNDNLSDIFRLHDKIMKKVHSKFST